MQTLIYVVREFKYKGYLPEQLQALPIESLLPLLNSRQRRSLDKRVGKFMTDEKRKLREEIKRNKEGKSNDEIKTHIRDMIILPDMIGATIKVHNGKEFVPVSIRAEMVGHYVGEYSITNKRVQHGAPGVGSSRSSLYVPFK